MTIARRAIETARTILTIDGTLLVTVNGQDGSYQFGPIGSQSALQASVGALVDHAWLRPGSYPSHSVSESPFNDALGSGRQLTVTCSGLRGSPDLIYVVQLYTQNPYGTVQVRVRNETRKATSVHAIRSVEATGDSIVNLGGRPSDERILSDSFSEDWPDYYVSLEISDAESHRWLDRIEPDSDTIRSEFRHLLPIPMEACRRVFGNQRGSKWTLSRGSKRRGINAKVL